MILTLWTAIISGILFTLSLLLFSAEEKNGRRLILPGFRTYADKIVAAWQVRFKEFSGKFGAGSLRVFLHFVLHQVLGLILYLIRWSEAQVNKLRNHNKTIARAVREVAEHNHLYHISKHKEAVALSDTEKQELKERSLNI